MRVCSQTATQASNPVVIEPRSFIRPYFAMNFHLSYARSLTV